MEILLPHLHIINLRVSVESGIKEMGIPQSKQMKQEENHTFSKDIKNGTAKEAVAKKATNLTHSEANDLTGNLNNTANTSQGQGPTQLISHQMEPNNGNEAMLTRMDQVPAADAPQNREQSIHKAVNISQDADPVKYNPYLASAASMTQQHASPAKSKDKHSIMIQQATPTRPIAGQCHGVKITEGEFEAVRSDILQQLQDVTEKLGQQQLGPLAPVQQKTKPVHHQKKTTAPVQKQTNRLVVHSHIQHEESRNFTWSQQRPTAKETTDVPLQKVRTVAPCDIGMRATADSVYHSEVSTSVRVAAPNVCKDPSRQVECRFGSKKEDAIPQLSAFKMQEPVRRLYSEVVRGITTQNLHSEEAGAEKKTKMNRSPSQKSKCVLSNVNETSTDLACQATDKAHNITEQSSTTKPSIAEVLDTQPTEPPDHSSQVSKQSKAQVNNDVNALNVHDLKLAKKPGSDGRSSQQTAEETVTTVQESSQQQGCTAMEENTIKKYNEPHQIPQPNKADNNTNGNTSSCIQKVNVKALTSQVQVVEGMLTAAPNNDDNNITTADTGVELRNLKVKVFLHQDTGVKSKKTHSSRLKALQQNKPSKNLRNVTRKEEMTVNGNTEKEKSGITSAVPPEHKVHTEGRWHPFTVNQSCSRKVRCQHNPETSLPPNVQKWFDACPNYLCEPPWVTTERLADCLVLRETQEEGGDSHQ